MFNDRSGMHHNGYHEGKEAFYFGTEAKAIIAARPELRTPEPRAIGELVACSCVLENRTIFQSISHFLLQLPRGLFHRGTIESKNTYFHPREEWEQQTALEPDAYYQQLHEKVRTRNLPFISQPRKGRNDFDGWITCARLWRAIPRHRERCLLIRSVSYRDCYDVTIGRHVAEVAQQPHQVITVGGEFFKNFSRLTRNAAFTSPKEPSMFIGLQIYL